ncbi:FmdB family zinc ribbon protein [Mycolicibacterium vanbaalenii]|uniref:FmdB family zinc ribbon protein n=1 Tax=Mycolicibacterium vanbaalenii TaxID=110539 RepID=UPI0013308CDD|nr:zinc ribbon domain-containing protein [Mycolicibacterium vanbaalenii]
MPSYTFRCQQDCADFVAQHPIAAPPETAVCPECGDSARRMIGKPALGVGRTSAMRLQDATRASADSPDVVTNLPAGSRRATPMSTNPLHRKLPRP